MTPPNTQFHRISIIDNLNVIGAISRDIDKSKLHLSNTNPCFNQGDISPTRTPDKVLERMVTTEAPLFVNEIAAKFAKPAAQVDASSGKKIVSEDPFLKSRPWLH